MYSGHYTDGFAAAGLVPKEIFNREVPPIVAASAISAAARRSQIDFSGYGDDDESADRYFHGSFNEEKDTVGRPISRIRSARRNRSLAELAHEEALYQAAAQVSLARASLPPKLPRVTPIHGFESVDKGVKPSSTWSVPTVSVRKPSDSQRSSQAPLRRHSTDSLSAPESTYFPARLRPLSHPHYPHQHQHHEHSYGQPPTPPLHPAHAATTNSNSNTAATAPDFSAAAAVEEYSLPPSAEVSFLADTPGTGSVGEPARSTKEYLLSHSPSRKQGRPRHEQAPGYEQQPSEPVVSEERFSRKATAWVVAPPLRERGRTRRESSTPTLPSATQRMQWPQRMQRGQREEGDERNEQKGAANRRAIRTSRSNRSASAGHSMHLDPDVESVPLDQVPVSVQHAAAFAERHAKEAAALAVERTLLEFGLRNAPAHHATSRQGADAEEHAEEGAEDEFALDQDPSLNGTRDLTDRTQDISTDSCASVDMEMEGVFTGSGRPILQVQNKSAATAVGKDGSKKGQEAEAASVDAASLDSLLPPALDVGVAGAFAAEHSTDAATSPGGTPLSPNARDVLRQARMEARRKQQERLRLAAAERLARLGDMGVEQARKLVEQQSVHFAHRDASVTPPPTGSPTATAASPPVSFSPPSSPPLADRRTRSLSADSIRSTRSTRSNRSSRSGRAGSDSMSPGQRSLREYAEHYRQVVHSMAGPNRQASPANSRYQSPQQPQGRNRSATPSRLPFAKTEKSTTHPPAEAVPSASARRTSNPSLAWLSGEAVPAFSSFPFFMQRPTETAQATSNKAATEGTQATAQSTSALLATASPSSSSSFSSSFSSSATGAAAKYRSTSSSWGRGLQPSLRAKIQARLESEAQSAGSEGGKESSAAGGTVSVPHHRGRSASRLSSSVQSRASSTHSDALSWMDVTPSSAAPATSTAAPFPKAARQKGGTWRSASPHHHRPPPHQQQPQGRNASTLRTRSNSNTGRKTSLQRAKSHERSSSARAGQKYLPRYARSTASRAAIPGYASTSEEEEEEEGVEGKVYDTHAAGGEGVFSAFDGSEAQDTQGAAAVVHASREAKSELAQLLSELATTVERELHGAVSLAENVIHDAMDIPTVARRLGQNSLFRPDPVDSHDAFPSFPPHDQQQSQQQQQQNGQKKKAQGNRPAPVAFFVDLTSPNNADNTNDTATTATATISPDRRSKRSQRASEATKKPASPPPPPPIRDSILLPGEKLPRYLQGVTSKIGPMVQKQREQYRSSHPSDHPSDHLLPQSPLVVAPPLPHSHAAYTPPIPTRARVSQGHEDTLYLSPTESEPAASPKARPSPLADSPHPPPPPPDTDTDMESPPPARHHHPHAQQQLQQSQQRQRPPASPIRYPTDTDTDHPTLVPAAAAAVSGVVSRPAAKPQGAPSTSTPLPKRKVPAPGAGVDTSPMAPLSVPDLQKEEDSMHMFGSIAANIHADRSSSSARTNPSAASHPYRSDSSQTFEQWIGGLSDEDRSTAPPPPPPPMHPASPLRVPPSPQADLPVRTPVHRSHHTSVTQFPVTGGGDALGGSVLDFSPSKTQPPSPATLQALAEEAVRVALLSSYSQMQGVSGTGMLALEHVEQLSPEALQHATQAALDAVYSVVRAKWGS